MDFGGRDQISTPAAERDSMASTPDACRSAQYRICPHPGELVRRVMSTHPASVNADSTAGERRLTENGGVRIRRDARRGRVRTKPSHWRNPHPVSALRAPEPG